MIAHSFPPTYALPRSICRKWRIASVAALILFPLKLSSGAGLADFLSTPFASHLSGDASGSRIAWVLNEQGRRNLYVAEAPGWTAHAVTHFEQDSGEDIDEIAWTPDGRALYFVRAADFENDGEDANPTAALQRPERTIWRASSENAPPRELTQGRAPGLSSRGDRVWFLRKGQPFSMLPDGSDIRSEFTVEGKAEDLQWSPDGSSVAFTNTRITHSFIGLFQPGTKQIRFLDAGVDNDGHPVWSPDGKDVGFIREPASTTQRIFGAKREGYPWSIRVVAVATGKGREIFHADPGAGSVYRGLASTQQLFWTAGDRIVFAWEKTGWLHLYSLAAASGSPIDLTPGDGEVENASFNGERTQLVFASNRGAIDGRRAWTMQADTPASLHTVTQQAVIEWEPVALKRGAVALLAADYNTSAHAEVVEGGAKHVLAPETVGASFPKALFVKPEVVTFPSVDGLPLHAEVFKPAGTGRHPAVVFFHGGSRRQMLPGFHYMYYYSNAYAMNQYLASLGYLVLAVNYRSGTGYGLDFREALHYGATGASEYQDVVASGKYLQARPDVDPKHIAAWGGSYGGYLTALALARDSDMYAAGVDWHGVHDWNLEFGPRLPGTLAERQEFERVAYASSPMAYVDGWRSPVLFIHGDSDRTVPFEETIQMVEKLRERHVPLEIFVIPNELHDFLLWKDWVAGYEATARFLGEQLRQNP